MREKKLVDLSVLHAALQKCEAQMLIFIFITFRYNDRLTTTIAVFCATRNPAMGLDIRRLNF